MGFLETPIQKSAYKFAKDAHRGQVRKGSPRPYISHCMEVARIVNKHGYPEDYVIAALLHDTVEDTDVTLHDLKIEFGQEVANIVKCVTVEKNPKSTWIKRKVDYIKNLTDAPEGAVVVSAADKLHNITETFEKWLKVGDAVFLIFNADKEKQKWYYRSLTEMYFLRGLFFENKSLLKMARSINKVLGKMGM
tara:strand:+ start:1116 stop:1691 length:576 start_codon:yes stop_codon:yes gene_type:complete